MPAEPIESWLRSGLFARVNGSTLKPLEHQRFEGMPLSVQRGQAEAFFLTDKTGNRHVLKKFHPGNTLDRGYLETVTNCLPRDEGFYTGTARHVLCSWTLRRGWRCYYERTLGRWLDGAMLMPMNTGLDWATIADDLRQGDTQLDGAQRLSLCQSLTGLIERLESHECSHRDLSSGNVFVNTTTGSASLIDFDSLYHPSLIMPAGTTGGTIGYAAPFVWTDGSLNADLSWCPYADRFALALLSVEFLILGKGCPLTSDGGMFEQDELNARSGQGLQRIRDRLKRQFPDVAGLLDAALGSSRFDDCPSPSDWRDAISSTKPVPDPLVPELQPLQIGSLNAPTQRAADSSRSIPGLSDMPIPKFALVKPPSQVIVLPSDPWKT